MTIFFHQYNVHKEALADEETNLWVHGWDADNIDYQDRCSMREWWKITPERKSEEFWGRGNGWIFMALADALRTYPKDSSEWTYFAVNFIKCVELFLPVRTKKQVTFELTPEDLQLLDRNMRWTVEPGEFEFMIGASSKDIKLRKTVKAL